jgi:hypothetical protein
LLYANQNMSNWGLGLTFGLKTVVDCGSIEITVTIH